MTTVDGQMLYHYCDAAALESIVRNNQIWLCPFALSNDSQEGLAWLKPLRKLFQENMPSSEDAFDKFRAHLRTVSESIGCYGISLSEHADKLSQWRGYAADGTGFSIGFARGVIEYLPRLGAMDSSFGPALGPMLQRVEYDEVASVERIRPFYDMAKEVIAKAFAPPGNIVGHFPGAIAKPPEEYLSLNNTLLTQWNVLFGIKDRAFEEEQEWRLSIAGLEPWMKHSFRVSRGMLAPYLAYQLPDPADLPAIRHVYLGPKNRTPLSVVRMLLDEHGLKDCDISISGASYR